MKSCHLHDMVGPQGHCSERSQKKINTLWPISYLWEKEGEGEKSNKQNLILMAQILKFVSEIFMTVIAIISMT